MITIRNNIIPFHGFIAIALWPFIFVRHSSWTRFTNDVKRHERIHGCQQVELTLVGIALSVVLALCGAGWWSLLCLPLFLWLYCIEWLVKFFCMGDAAIAYVNISFECESYDNESDPDYLESRRPFAWLRYIFSSENYYRL